MSIFETFGTSELTRSLFSEGWDPAPRPKASFAQNKNR